MATVWRYVHTTAPAGAACAALPDRAVADGAALEVSTECLGGWLVRGDGTRRFRVRWTSGRWPPRRAISWASPWGRSSDRRRSSSNRLARRLDRGRHQQTERRPFNERG